MIKIYFGHLEKEVVAIDSTFNNVYEKEWNEDKDIQDILADIDKCNHLTGEFYQHEILGTRIPIQMSGGSKNLILLIKRPDLITKSSNYVDNCISWIERLNEKTNATIAVTHLIKLNPENTNEGFYCVNEERIIKTKEDFIDAMYKYI